MRVDTPNLTEGTGELPREFENVDVKEEVRESRTFGSRL